MFVTSSYVKVPPTDTFPVTFNELNVPSEVTFGCAAVCNVPANVDAVTPAIPVMFVALSPTIFPFAFIFPETVAELRVPSDVILGCAAV